MSKETDDLAFLAEGQPENKVTREVARNDFKRFLDDRNVTKKVLRKANADEESLDDFKGAMDIAVACIMDGTLVVTDSTPSTIIHNLTNPPVDSSGSILYDTLEYKFTPNLSRLQGQDKFKQDAHIAKTRALLSAMTGKAIAELGQISLSDIDVVAAIAFFLI